jgi:hypothetical protein
MSLIKNSNGIFANINSKLFLKIAESTCFEIERNINSTRVTTIYKIKKILLEQDILHVDAWREKNGENAAHWSSTRNFRFSNPVNEFYLSTMRIVTCPDKAKSPEKGPDNDKGKSPKGKSPAKKSRKSSSPNPKEINCNFEDQKNPEDNLKLLLSKDPIIKALPATTEKLKFFDFKFPVNAELKAVKTGHGFKNDCLIHAILNCCDEDFRQRSSDQKDVIASHFRRKTLANLLIIESQYYTRKQYKASLKSKLFLEDRELGKIAECLKLCFLVFSVGGSNTKEEKMKVEIIGANDYKNPPKKCFLIQNNGTRDRTGNHYSSVCDPEDEDFSTSYEEAEELVKSFYEEFPS